MSLRGTVWKPIGPSPIAEGGLRANGVATAIATHPNNANIVYLGTAGGGVWRTMDAGGTWTPLFDVQLALGIGEPGALAIDPNNTDVLYAGTSPRTMLGLGSFGNFGVSPPLAGVLKSTDAGASWIRLGSGYPAGNTGNARQFINDWINVIIVDPANSSIVYLSSSRGVFRSIDGGRNWTLGAGLPAGIADARSLVLDASSPTATRILYAGIAGSGVYRSNDGGRNWTLILSGATAVVANALCPTPPCIPARSLGKFIVALAPPATPPNAAGVQVLYATMEGQPVNTPPLATDAPDPVGLFMSTDGGTNWTRRTATGMPPNTQGGYSFHMAVDPASPGDGINDIIYFGTVNQARSSNSGGSFTALPTNPPTASNGLHADTHSWAFFRQPAGTPSIVYCGNDGGLFRSINDGGDWTGINGGGLQTGLFYNIDIKPNAAADVTVGALQDNQVQTTVGGSGLGWVATVGGDGFDVAYDGAIAKQVYSTSGCGNGVNRSTDDGANWTNITPPWTAAEAACGNQLTSVSTDPSNGGIIYVSSSATLWQSSDGGGTWRSLQAFAGAGIVDVARSNGNNVVIAVGTQVWVSTNARAATVGPPTGVTFTNISAGLPGTNVARAIFDPNDPTIIYAVCGGFSGTAPTAHAFRTTISAGTWTDISPALDLPFNAIALDGTETPTTIYVGNDFGVMRSVDGGSSWSILDNIHFPNVPVTDLILSQPAGVLRAATYGRGVFEFVKPAGPVIAVNLEKNLAFGTVCSGPESLTLEIFNVGAADLIVYSVQRLMGSSGFTVLGNPGTPVTIAPGDHLDFTVQYSPATIGTPGDAATIRIRSNDPAAPVVDLQAKGIGGAASLVTAIANSGNIGSACLGTFREEELTINNAGSCPLSISNITSSSAEFLAPHVTSYPLVVSPGGSLDVVIRFQPASFGAKSGTITLTSNDPVGVRTVAVSGFAPAPRLNPLIADSGNFGNVCVGSFADEPLILNNSGECRLSITSITSSGSEFLAPRVGVFPLTVAAGDSLEVPIRFQPTGFGAKSATITITSDDSAGPQTIGVSGNAPSGKLAVTGSTTFGGVTACCCADRTISICNVGDCDLHVTSVRFKRESHHWKLLHNPFPATLHAGSCLDVVIRYKATEKCSRCCELIIESDDPSTPVKTMEVLAYTIWDPCRCKECCEDCRKGCCDKRHQDSCCRQGYPCCCDDDENDEDES